MTTYNLFTAQADEIFEQAVKRAARGTTVRSLDAPALSTQFTKSKSQGVARPGVPGAFAQIVFPEDKDIAFKNKRKHGATEMFGYVTTARVDAYSAGFGERAAKALAREENTFQLKGSFAAAALSYSKLRARVEAREGDVEPVDEFFAQCWGITKDQAYALPKLHVEGSEATRLAAMEDRAYHALSGHPGHTGGFRIDTASLDPHALGDKVPLNWPRLRTSVKAIAQAQCQGDLNISDSMDIARESQNIPLVLDLVVGTQPTYHRPFPWERLVPRVISGIEPPPLVEASLQDIMIRRVCDRICTAAHEDVTKSMRYCLDKLARVVTASANRAYEKTVKVILEHDRERALLAEHLEENYDDLSMSQLTTEFSVPRYKVTRSSLFHATKYEVASTSKLPDIASCGPPKHQLDLAEFREANVMMPLDIAGALNLAVYITVNSEISKPYVYMLMKMVSVPREEGHVKAALRLRREELYQTPAVYNLGQFLLGDGFMNTLGLLLTSMVRHQYLIESSVHHEIWDYLTRRCKKRGRCPVVGGWRDLIVALRDMPESWTLYYWMRVSIGKRHAAASSGILAPVAAGRATDLVTMFRMGIKLRKQVWSAYYTAEYKMIEESLSKDREERRKRKLGVEKEPSTTTKYVPPHLRKLIDLEHEYDADRILDRVTGFTEQQYERMVEMQSKAKFFSAIEVMTRNDHICVGLTDESMLEMLVDFYQARWYSLKVRIDKANEQGRIFTLGRTAFPEHPWGELCTDLPITVNEMLKYMESLDDRAWTLPPTYLQTKFSKSLTELWDDISQEIATILEYLETVHSGEVELQDERLAEADLQSSFARLSDLAPITIPTPGYIPPYVLPRKTVTIYNEGGKKSIESAVSTFMEIQSDDEECTADDLIVDLDSSATLGILNEDFGLAEGIDAAVEESWDVDEEEMADDETEYLTFREIWDILKLPNVTDDKMKQSFGLPLTANLDVPHADSLVGPVVPVSKKAVVEKLWRRKRGMMLLRCTGADAADYEEDM